MTALGRPAVRMVDVYKSGRPSAFGGVLVPIQLAWMVKQIVVVFVAGMICFTIRTRRMGSDA